MAARPETHPTDTMLQAFGRGQLEAGAIEWIIDHLEECADCKRRAAELPDPSRDHPAAAASTPVPADTSGKAESTARSAPPPAPPAPALPGVPPELATQYGYEVVRELGRGGMGVVYLARNKMMDRLEVLKTVNKAQVGRPEALERFLQEIRTAARLNHPNVALAYSVLQLPDFLVLAMEYIEGEDLFRAVQTRGALPIAEACYCAREAALALQHAAEMNMVHRDIKPGNLIRATRPGKKAVVKIVDFGLAKAAREGPASHDLTGTGQVMGTPDYIAPEQLRDAKRADIRADIYSLGCTLYCLLTGGPPFKGNSTVEVLLAHEKQEAKPLRNVRPDVPKAVAAAVAKMMAKDPAQRYQEPIEVAEVLAPYVGAENAERSGTLQPPGVSRKSGDALVARPANPARPPSVTRASSKASGIIPPAASDGDPAPKAKQPEAPRGDGRAALAVPLAAWWSLPQLSSWPWAVRLVGTAFLFAALGMLAAGVFKPRAATATIVVENVPADADIFLDGQPVPSERIGDAVTLSAVREGTRQVQMQRGGQALWSEKVIVKAGDAVRLQAKIGPGGPAP